MLKVVPVVFQGVECLVLDFPTGTTTTHQDVCVLFSDEKVGYPGKVLSLSGFGVVLLVDQEVYLQVRVGQIELCLVEKAKCMCDRELRLLIMDAIERFEVSLRSQWAYHLSHLYKNPHIHLDADVFKPERKKEWNHSHYVAVLQETVKHSSEVFIRHLRVTYSEALPPIWAVCEIMTFGQLSKWYSNLRYSRDRNAIAHAYDLMR